MAKRLFRSNSKAFLRLLIGIRTFLKKEIMKKYIKPSVDIVELENVSLMAASGDEVNTTLSDETPGGVSFHSRNFSLWDDDTEE